MMLLFLSFSLPRLHAFTSGHVFSFVVMEFGSSSEKEWLTRPVPTQGLNKSVTKRYIILFTVCLRFELISNVNIFSDFKRERSLLTQKDNYWSICFSSFKCFTSPLIAILFLFQDCQRKIKQQHLGKEYGKPADSFLDFPPKIIGFTLNMCHEERST